jgi:succinate dehydrogenase / fumarate reductase cytochrome b subunit
MSATPKVRPKYYDLNLLHLPPPGLVSIFHRITGAVMFLALIPAALLLLQTVLSSEAGYRSWVGIWANPLAKLIAVGFVWAYVHHFMAGIRYLMLDVHVGIEKEAARSSARVVLIAGIVVTALIAWRIW